MSSVERRRRIPEVLKQVKLEENRGLRIKAYSKGMQQRLGIACALLADPDLLFLDEPTSALDPIGRREVREILVSLRKQGKTVFLNSHLLNEVEMICDEVAIINKGRIISSGGLAKLLAHGIEVELRIGGLTEEMKKALEQVGKMVFVEESAEHSRVRVAVAGAEDVPSLAEIVIKGGGRLYELTLKHRSLEDLFMHLVQSDDRL
jgi:ABC-2 type transport system ATP-binding protein